MIQCLISFTNFDWTFSDTCLWCNEVEPLIQDGKCLGEAVSTCYMKTMLYRRLDRHFDDKNKKTKKNK